MGILTGVDARPVSASPALSVKTFPGRESHKRRYFQLMGVSPPIDYRVHNSSLVNLVRGFMTRVLFYKGTEPVAPRRGVYKQRLNNFRRMLLERFSTTTPVTREQFVNYYQGRKRTIYQHACESLQTRSITRKDASIKAFVKAEFINFSDKPDPDPRIISPRDPRYNVEVGRFLRPVEHDLYRCIDAVYGECTVFKGLNSETMGREFRAKWDKYRFPCAVGLDASRFDQHVSVEALKWEHSIYNGIYHDKELRKLLKWQLVNTGIAVARDGKLKYSVPGRRMSGDMNTSMGNCLLMCALVHRYLVEKRVKASLANNGDDCVLIMEQRDHDRFIDGLTQWFLEMGFQLKVEPKVVDFERIEFCQTHPFTDGAQWIMVRNFPQCLAKDSLSLKELDRPTVWQAWLAAVSLGGLALAGGVPVIQEFYHLLGRSAKALGKIKRARKGIVEVQLEGGLQWLSKGMMRKYQPVTTAARYSFYLAFGVTPDQQVELERYYSGITCLQTPRELAVSDVLPPWFQ